jgi:hypothetical protein
MRIHIDENPYDSPNPTTGAALYVLGNIDSGLELFREVTGDREDPGVPNGPDVVHLKEDEHFHSGKAKTYRIFINGQAKVVATKWVTYAQIVAIAFPNPPTGPNIIYTVGYEDGPPRNSSGSLTAQSGKIQVKDGMIFDVTPTDKS